MIFLVVSQKRKATIFGEVYNLEPVSYPEVDLNQILVCDDPIGAILLTRHSPILLRAEFDPHLIPGFPQPLKISPSQLPANRSLLILRSGGIGDHIMMAPAIRALKQTLPEGSEIWLVTETVSHCLYEGNPDIARLFPMPIRMSHFMKADYYLDFSSTTLSLYKEMNLTDYCLHSFNMDYTTVENKQPFIPDQLTQSSRINNIFYTIREQNRGRRFVLLHWFTSTLVRDIPLDVLSILPQNFPDILFIVAHEHTAAQRTHEQISRLGLEILNLSDHMKSLKDYVTAINNCDAVVSADTCTYHIAAALKKPALALFGPVGAELRIRYYSTVIPLNADYSGVTCKSPCGLDRIWKDDLKKEDRWERMSICPEAHEKDAVDSPCISSITPERLNLKFRQLVDSIKL